MPVAKAKKKIKKEKFAVGGEGKVYINATFNNTSVTITDGKGATLDWISSGRLGYTGTRRSTPFVATTTLERAVEKAKQFGIRKLAVFIKGPGPGREAVLRVLRSNRDMDVLSISDVTPIPHNGPRPPKKRRV